MYFKLIKNTSFYAFASIFPALLNLILLPIYTRYLDPTEYGIIALTQVYFLILTIFCGLSLHSAIGRFYVEYISDEQRRKKFISTLFLLLFFVALLFLFLIDINGQRIIRFFYSKSKLEYFPYFKIATWAAFFAILIQFFADILRIEERAKHFFIASIFSAFFTSLLVILCVVILQKGVVGYLFAFLIGYIFSFHFYFYLTKNNFILTFNPTLLKDPLKYSVPLIPHALAGYIFMYSDRIILEKYVPLAAIGIYSLADQIARVFKMGVDSFNAAYSPHFLKTANHDKNLSIQQSTTLAELSVFILCSLILIISIFMPEFSSLLFDPKYYMVWSMFPILASAFVFRSLYCFTSGGLFFEKKTLRIFLITITAAIANITLNLIFIPIYGVMVAVFTTLIAYLITFAMSYFMAKDVFLAVKRYKQIFHSLSVFFVILFFSYLLNFNLSRFNSLNIFFLKVVLILSYFFLLKTVFNYKDLIENLCDFLKHANAKKNFRLFK